MLGTIFADPSAAQELLNNAPRSVLEKIRDFISELLDTISAAARRIAGAKELTALTELEGWAQDMAKMLDAAMSETGRRQIAQAETEIRFSLQTLEDGTPYVRIDTDQERFDGLSLREMVTEARKAILEKFRGKVIGEGENRAYVNRRSADEYTHPANRRNISGMDAKLHAAPEIDNLLRVSNFVEHTDHNADRHPEATGGWDISHTIFSFGDKLYDGEIQIMNTDKGRLFYDITHIKARNTAQRVNGIKQETNSRAPTISGASENIIFEGSGKVKRQNSAKGEKAEQRSDTNSEGNIRYSLANEGESTPGITLEDVNTLRNIGRKSINAFTSEEIRATEAWARKFYRELGTKSPFFRAWFGDWRANDTTEMEIVDSGVQQEMPSGSFINKDTGWAIRISRITMDETLSRAGKNRLSVKLLGIADKLVENAVLLDSIVTKLNSGKKGTNSAFIHKMYVPVRIGGEIYIAKMNVDEYYERNDTKKRVYHLRTLEMEMPSQNAVGPENESVSSVIPKLALFDGNYTVADLFALVKRFDKDFSPKPASEVVNEDGTPKVVYHGTGAEFWTFDRNMIGSTYGADEEGFFFTDKHDVADWAASDAANVTGGDERIVAAHLRIKNPYVLANKDPATYYDARKEGILQNARERGTDGIIINGNVENGNLYVVFDPEQIKSATDNVGTFDAGNPDIRYSLFDETADASQLLSENERLRRLHETFASKVGDVSRYKGESSREAADISSGKPTAHGGCLALRLRNSSGEQPMMARKVLWKKVVSLYPTRSATSLMGMAVLASRRQLALMRTCLTNSEKVTPISCLKCLLR